MFRFGVQLTISVRLTESGRVYYSITVPVREEDTESCGYTSTPRKCHNDTAGVDVIVHAYRDGKVVVACIGGSFGVWDRLFTNESGIVITDKPSLLDVIAPALEQAGNIGRWMCQE